MDVSHAKEIEYAIVTLQQRFGKDSVVQAAIRAVELSEEGDFEGAQIWCYIYAELIDASDSTKQIH